MPRSTGPSGLAALGGRRDEDEAMQDQERDAEMPQRAAPTRPAWLRWLPLLILLGAGALAWFALDVPAYLSFETLADNREWLLGQVEDYRLRTIVAYVLAYVLVTAFSIPGGSVLTIVGGFLFGTWLATGYTVLGATVGAVAVFLAARTALGDSLRRRVGGSLQRMERGFQENALSYLLVLRLIPVFPFWLVNLVPAFLGVSLRTYVVGTLLGIVPGTFVYASLGNGVGALLDKGQTPDLAIIFSAEILTPILGLAALAMLPVVYKKWRARRAARQA
jgi:uncharacterized membrane protein YdjX (TVP38/TMEM64 family)